jgi:peptide/nickel transport system substrate-binding protein
VGCAAPAAGLHRDPQTLVVVEPSDANTMDPLFSSNAAAFLYYRLVFEGLGRYGAGYSVFPALATHWTHTADGLHWTAVLRRGVRWSDGAPFTSADVLWTWKAMLDPAVGFPYSGLFGYVDRVSAAGPYAVRFDLKTRNATFVWDGLTSPILPAHILAKIPAGQLRTSSFGQHPVGTGPYIVEDWQHDDHIVFARNPHWWGGAPKIARIQIRTVLNDEARMDALEDGSADLIDNLGTNNYAALEQQDPDLNFVHLPGLYSYFIYTNLRVPGIADLNVRRAMMYAWDRKAVVQGLLRGDAVVDDSYVPLGVPYFHDDDIMHYPFAPGRARRILDAAGWKPGADGIRRKDNIRLAFDLTEPNGGNSNEAAEFQADMRAIGIAVSVRELDYATFIDNLSNFRYELAFLGFGGDPDPDEFTFLHSSQIAPTGNNGMGYRNAVVDRDLVAGLQALDKARRKPYYDEIQRVTSQTLPVLWGWDSSFRAAYSPRLLIDRKTMLAEIYFWWNVYDWRLRR